MVPIGVKSHRIRAVLTHAFHTIMAGFVDPCSSCVLRAVDAAPITHMLKAISSEKFVQFDAPMLIL